MLTISIDRQAKKWALFDGMEVLHKFTPYEDEGLALIEAKKLAISLSEDEPEVVYPKITRMRMW